MPKIWSVTVPVAGVLYLEGRGETEQEAIANAMDQEWTFNDIGELDAYKQLVQGNVLYPHVNRASAEFSHEEPGEDEGGED